MKHSLMKLGPVLLCIAAMAGCDSTWPSVIEGNYTAIVFVTTDQTGPTNQLQLGSTLGLRLDDNGTTSGHLHFAAQGGEPALDADMNGTWTQNGDVIEIDQAADTFVRDMAFLVQRAADGSVVLVGDDTFDGVRINISLVRES